MGAVTSEQQVELRDYLKSFVARPGWSTKRLAEESGVNLNSLYTFLSNEKKRMGHSMLNQLAPVMGVAPESLHRIAGLLPNEGVTKPSQSDAWRKINLLIEMLSPEEQEMAIEALNAFRKKREAEAKAASQRKLKRS